MVQRNSLVADQKSVWCPVEDEDSSFLDDGSPSRLSALYLETLSRDTSLYIMPIGGRSSARKEFAVKLQPPNTSFEQVLADALAERHHSYAYRLEHEVCDFFQKVARRVMEAGEALFEVVYLRDRQTEDLKGFELVDIDVRTIRRDGISIVQVVPADWASRHNLPREISLDLGRLITFSLPTDKREFFAMREALAKLGAAPLPRMYSAAQAQSLRTYDASEHIRAENIALAAATRHIGWNAGQTWTDTFLEFYTVHRRLVFERFLIQLRESVLRTLNEALTSIAPQFGTTATLHIEGLPTMADVDRATKELRDGKRTFNSVLDDFSLR